MKAHIVYARALEDQYYAFNHGPAAQVKAGCSDYASLELEYKGYIDLSDLVQIDGREAMLYNITFMG